MKIGAGAYIVAASVASHGDTKPVGGASDGNSTRQSLHTFHRHPNEDTYSDQQKQRKRQHPERGAYIDVKA